jgi:8-oxo-dGTP pyrophosphatase MutT (NUDIX family)
MTERAAPDAPVHELEPYLAARLLPLGPFPTEASRSDYDLNPDGRIEGRVLTPAAVLVPLVERHSGLTVLLTRRSDSLRRHSGQVAFPGGRADPGEDPVTTALRETFEEVGVRAEFIRPIGMGDTYETGTGFAITPVVAFVRPGFKIVRHEVEVAEVFETPFAFLMDPGNHELRVMRAADGVERRFYAMPYEERTIWGATAGIVRALYDRWFGS